MDLGITLAASDVLIINCDPRARAQAISLNGSYVTGDGTPYTYLLGTSGITNTIGNDATFPYMIPGANTVTMAGANGLSFSWSDAFAL